MIETNREATTPGKDLDRRAVLAMGAGASAAAVASTRTQAQVAVPWSVGTASPKTHAPADAVDCHHHIYSSRFKVDPNSTLRPGGRRPFLHLAAGAVALPALANTFRRSCTDGVSAVANVLG